MTTELNAAAARTLASLRASLNEGIATCAAELANMEAQALTGEDMPHVLYARCGMVVVPSAHGYRLGGTHDGLKLAAKFTPGHALRTATAWNRGLTTAQHEARCDVRALAVTTALELAISEMRTTLDQLDTALPAHAAAAREA